MEFFKKEVYAAYASVAFAFILVLATAVTIKYCLNNRPKTLNIEYSKIVSFRNSPSTDWVSNGDRFYRVIVCPEEDVFETLRINKTSFIKLCDITDRIKLRKLQKDTLLTFSKESDSQIYKLK